MMIFHQKYTKHMCICIYAELSLTDFKHQKSAKVRSYYFKFLIWQLFESTSILACPYYKKRKGKEVT